MKVGLWLCFAVDPRRSRRDLSAAAMLLLLALGLESSSVAGARYVLLPTLLGYVALSVARKHRYVAVRFCLGLLAAGQFYAAQPLSLVPMQVLFLLSLLVLQGAHLFFGQDAEAASTAKGVTLALLGYLLLWPTVGMRFSGIDFRFMFDWVPAARYEELWWLIGLGMLLKFSLPYALLIDLGRRSSTGQTLTWVYVTFTLKLAALSVFAAWYATSHALLTNGALEILAELAFADPGERVCVALAGAGRVEECRRRLGSERATTCL